MIVPSMKKEHSHILKVRNLVVSDLQTGSSEPILKGLDFEIRDGEILGVVGASGSGKSLTAKSILDLLPSGLKIEKGDIQYFPGVPDQFNLIGASPGQLDHFRRKHIAMIFQNPALSLNPTLKIREQLKVIVRLSKKNTADSSLDDLLLKMGLEDPKRISDAFPHQLSGGQLQRVIVGMTILKKPTLWIADEPTTALDPEIRVQILELMREVYTEIGGSMLYISHDMRSVKKMADRVILIDRGKIIASGLPNELIDDHRFDFLLPMGQLGSEVENDSEENALADTAGLNDSLLDVSDISKTFVQMNLLGFGEKKMVKAVDRISFSIFPGDSLGIIGVSGSGKSTIANLLVGLEKIDQGSIRFQNKEISKFSFEEWKTVRQNIQVVHQNPTQSLSPHLSVRVHIEEAIQIKWGSDKTKVKDQFEQLMLDVGLGMELEGRFPFQLSGGECQRVCIARSLALQPKLLVCDEITSALDFKTQQQIISLLLQIRQKYNFSLICISHDLAVISQMTDKLILLDHGKIVEFGGTNAFLSSPKSDQGKKIVSAFATLA